MEIRARDEHYSKAVLDIVVRPSVGVATYREKYLESRLRGALEPIFLASMAPRTLVQVVAQIVQVGELALQKVTATAANEYNPVLLLPALITTCLLALIDAGVPLASTLDTYLVTINPTTTTTTTTGKNQDNQPNININPYSDPSLLHSAKSIHVLCYSTAASGVHMHMNSNASGDTDVPGELVLVESEGSFSWEEWAQVDRLVRRECMGLPAEGNEDVDMDVDMGMDMETRWGKGLMATFVREVVGRKVVRDLNWRK